MITTNTQTECSCPTYAPTTGYRKGCRCDRCVTAQRASVKKASAKFRTTDKQKAYRAEYRADPFNRAKETLQSNARHAERLGYAPINASIEEVMELQTSTTTCQCCGAAGPLETDHCHDTGALRGMLCTSCNQKDVLNG